LRRGSTSRQHNAQRADRIRNHFQALGQIFDLWPQVEWLGNCLLIGDLSDQGMDVIAILKTPEGEMLRFCQVGIIGHIARALATVASVVRHDAEVDSRIGFLPASHSSMSGLKLEHKIRLNRVCHRYGAPSSSRNPPTIDPGMNDSPRAHSMFLRPASHRMHDRPAPDADHEPFHTVWFGSRAPTPHPLRQAERP
jgi:hypothetical protein